MTHNDLFAGIPVQTEFQQYVKLRHTILMQEVQIGNLRDEISYIRKLILILLTVTLGVLVIATVAAVSSGYVAYQLYTFLDSLHTILGG